MCILNENKKARKILEWNEIAREILEISFRLFSVVQFRPSKRSNDPQTPETRNVIVVVVVVVVVVESTLILNTDCAFRNRE